MRLGRIGPDARAILIEGDAFAYVADCDPNAPRAVRELIADEAALGRVGAGALRAPRYPLDPAALRAPVEAPRVLAVGLNYRSHAEEVGRMPGDTPTVFAKLPGTLADPYGEVRTRAVSATLDYEAELAVIVGRPLDDASPEEAERAVFGYAVADDLTLREYARPDTLTLAKGLAGACPLGPWITTADEAGDWRALRLRSWVNGEPRQDARCEEMIFAPADVLSFASRFTPLLPGDVLLTGSPAGSGASFDPPRWLRPGDVVRCEAVGLGHVETTVA